MGDPTLAASGLWLDVLSLHYWKNLNVVVLFLQHLLWLEAGILDVLTVGLCNECMLLVN